MNLLKRCLSLVIVFATLLTAALFITRSVVAAPQRRGTSVLSGVVLGPNDKPVANAAVSYQSSGGNAPHAVHTDAHGRFTIHKLPADNYDLRASSNGVFSEWEKNVTLHTGQTRSVTLRLIYAKQIPKGSISAANH
ncbi:MAG TPA: carboxypeptidase-like regulatory domain-containing protein [Dongiaceae bacterium]|nr:carboxypeptidase-like regulatory domain-containing protein [Dongiaceae bacterium]